MSISAQFVYNYSHSDRNGSTETWLDWPPAGRANLHTRLRRALGSHGDGRFVEPRESGQVAVAFERGSDGLDSVVTLPFLAEGRLSFNVSIVAGFAKRNNYMTEAIERGG